MNYAAHDLSNLIGMAVVDTSQALGRGATGVVYPATLAGRASAAKIYHERQTIDFAKIRAMLANPPSSVRLQLAGEPYPQLAWPMALLSDSSGSDVGYLMPLVDIAKAFPLDYYYDQTLLRKLNSPSEGALSYKLEIARNLSLLVADLHDHGHYFIDMKPQNIRVARSAHVVTLLDCDGFSISGADGKRFPAALVSTDYISPEASRGRLPLAGLGEDQDRYALAVILFQLLNRGTHPFQGIIKDPGIDAHTNDEKAAKGLYPHGMTPDARIAPRPQSIHFLFDHGLRALFDAAFAGQSNARPTARDWAKCLDRLLGTKALTRCEKQPYDISHMRFKGMQCPACYLSGLKNVRPQTRPQIVRVEPEEARQELQQPTGQNTTTLLSKFGWLVLFVVVVFIVATYQSPRPLVPSAPVLTAPSTAPRTDVLTSSAVCERVQKGDHQLIVELRHRAELGDVPAQACYGESLLRARGMDRDIANGWRWLELAASRGNTRALSELGIAYATGDVVARDCNRAFDLISRARNSGSLEDISNLGVLQQAGCGTSKDPKRAFELFLEGANKGDKYAMWNLAEAYAKGIGVARDYKQALHWAQESEKLGNPALQMVLDTQKKR